MKVWVVLQRLGVSGIGAVYDVLCDSASALHAQLLEIDGVQMLHTPESNILAWRPSAHQATDVAALRAQLHREESAWITATQIGGKACLRVTMMNPRSDAHHRQRLVNFSRNRASARSM